MASAALGYSWSDDTSSTSVPRLEEDEPPVAVVVGQRPERLVAQGDLRVEPPRLLDCERGRGGPRLGHAQ